jgi:hypothetical protein
MTSCLRSRPRRNQPEHAKDRTVSVQLKPGSETSSRFIYADAATVLPSRAKQPAAGPSNPTRGARFQNGVVNDQFVLFMEQQKVDDEAKDAKITGLTTELGRVSGKTDLMVKEIKRMSKTMADFVGSQRAATSASLSDVDFAPVPVPAHTSGAGPAPAPRQNVADDPNPGSYGMPSRDSMRRSQLLIDTQGYVKAVLRLSVPEARVLSANRMPLQPSLRHKASLACAMYAGK